MASAATRALAVAEVLLEIVGYLGQGDLIQTLHVSRTWRAASEVVLYVDPDHDAAYLMERSPSNERLGMLVRTLGDRPDLAARVKKLHLSLNNQGSPTATQSGVQLLVRCTNLRALEAYSKLAEFGRALGGRLGVWLTEAETETGISTGDSLSSFISALASYSPNLTELQLSSPDAFAALAPVLARFPNLRTLQLYDFLHDQTSAVHWPKPVFHLTYLDILSDDEGRGELSRAELEWLTASSRATLQSARVMPCAGSACEAFAHTWGALRSLTLGQDCELDGPASRAQALSAAMHKVEVGRVDGLERLELTGCMRGETDEETDKFLDEVREAVARFNKEIGREVVRCDLC